MYKIIEWEDRTFEIEKDGKYVCMCFEKDFAEYVLDLLNNAQQSMHWTAGIVRRFKHFPIVKFILSFWHSLASRQ